MPNTPDNRKIISLAALSEFKTLLIQDFNGRYVPYSGADASVNLGANNFITSSYFEARSVSNDVINAYTRYRAGSVVVEDSSAQNTKIINFPVASELSNSNTFATREWSEANLVKINDNINIVHSGSSNHGSVTVNSPTGIQSQAFAKIRTYSETGEGGSGLYAFSELVLDGYSGTTRYRRDYIQVGNYKLNFPSLSADKTFATTDQIPDTSNFVIKNNAITGATKCKITYDSKGLVTGGADLSASDIPDLSESYLSVTGGDLNGDLLMTGNNISGASNIGSHTFEFFNSDYATIYGRLYAAYDTDENDNIISTGTVLTAMETYRAGSHPAIKGTFYFFKQKASSGTIAEDVATEQWVQNQGYTTNTGTVTSVAIGVGTGLAIDDASAITTSGTRTISIASGYKLPTTSEWNAKANSADLGTAAFVNTGTSQGNVPVLGVGGKLSNSVLPAIAITETFVCATQAAMLALDAQTGDICVRTDLSKTFILQGREPATLSDWVELATPTTGIVSINGDTGPVVIFNYLASASKSGQTLTITNNGGGTVSLENTWRPLGTGANDAAAGNHNHDTRYLQLSGGTMTGQLQVNSLIFGYNYTNSNNRAAFMLDKPGGNYSGVGAHAESDTIYFGACDGSGNWVDSYKQKWKFNGSIIENGTALSDKYLSKAGDGTKPAMSNITLSANIWGTTPDTWTADYDVAPGYPYGQLIRFKSNVSGAIQLTDFYIKDGADALWVRNNWNAQNNAENAGWAVWHRIALYSDIPSSLPANGGNADTVDNEHASAFAHIGTANNLIMAGNEFNFIPSSFTPDTVWFNYRTTSGYDATGITTYNLGDGKGGLLGTIIHTGNIGSQSVNYANSAGSVAWDNVTGKPSFATVATSGSYNDLSNKPTIPTVSDATITIKQTGVSDQTFTLNGSAVTINLADTNTWRPLGTGANDAAAGNHTHFYLVTEGDNRNIATAPNDYSDKLTFAGLKTNSCINNPSSDSYSYVLGLRGWSDNSGGYSHELAFNNSGIFHRQENGSNTWGSWNRLAFASEIPTNNNQLTNGAGYITSSALSSYLPLTGGTITGNVIIQSDVSRSLSVKKGTSQQGDGEVVIHTTVISGGAEGEILVVDRMGGQTKIRAAGIFPNGLNNKLIFPSISSDETLATQEWVSSQGYTTDSVSGANDGTNWTSITINGVTKNIPSGTGSLTLDNVSDGTTRKLNKVSAGSSAGLGEAQLATAVVTGAQNEGLLKLTKTPGFQILRLTTSYYPDRIVMSQQRAGDAVLNLPYTLGTTKTLATTDQIPTVKHLYKHACVVRINYCPYLFEFYSTSNSSTSLYNIMSRAIGKVLANLYNIGEMLAITGTYTSGSYVKIDADHYYKNNNNYMFREGWSGYDVTLDQESIEEV